MPFRSHKGVIFLAEDEDHFRENLQDLLEYRGYLVLPARDGVEALARMRGIFGSSVAIIDLYMPGMSGVDLISAMRADDRLAHIPIVVVTGMRNEPPPGVDRFLRKPLALRDVLHAVEELMA